jgi:hypothetical protein
MRRELFAFVEVCELLLRYYKPEPTRLRPTDRMVAHTGFLTFGRRIEPSNDERAQGLQAEIEGRSKKNEIIPEGMSESDALEVPFEKDFSPPDEI